MDGMIIEHGKLKLQLHAARYAFHSIVKARYKEQLNMPHPDVVARIKPVEMYRQAMANYDGIIENAVSGASHDANQAEMDKGFE